MQLSATGEALVKTEEDEAHRSSVLASEKK
jgi:hypothetical protein